MNEVLKKKRDKHRNFYLSEPLEVDQAFTQGYDQAVADVIELLGEFDEAEAKQMLQVWLQSNVVDDCTEFESGARYMHAQMMAKFKG